MHTTIMFFFPEHGGCYDNDNDNILVDHNIEIEIIMYNSLKNQIIDWSGDYY